MISVENISAGKNKWIDIDEAKRGQLAKLLPPNAANQPVTEPINLGKWKCVDQLKYTDQQFMFQHAEKSRTVSHVRGFRLADSDNIVRAVFYRNF